MEPMRLIFVSFLTIVFSLHSFVPAISQEVEDEREFSYVAGTENGPEKWAAIHENWTLCGTGKMQSPIDLSSERVRVASNLGKVRRRYRPAAATMLNRGHDIELKWANGAGGLWLDGEGDGTEELVLRQLHWHSPSEHTLNGKSFPLELHMVHQGADRRRIAVVGILYKIGRPDPFLAKMEKYIHGVTDVKGAEEEVGVVDPREIKRGSSKYYRYIGSLTTPPCTEGVVWTIVNKVRTVSRGQLKLLRDAVHDDMEKNARPRQPSNDRLIGFYRPLRAGN